MDITFTTSNDSLPTSHIQPVEYSHTCYQDFLFKLSTFHKNYTLTNNLGDRIANCCFYFQFYTIKNRICMPCKHTWRDQVNDYYKTIWTQTIRECLTKPMVTAHWYSLKAHCEVSCSLLLTHSIHLHVKRKRISYNTWHLTKKLNNGYP